MSECLCRIDFAEPYRDMNGSHIRTLVLRSFPRFSSGLRADSGIPQRPPQKLSYRCRRQGYRRPRGAEGPVVWGAQKVQDVTFVVCYIGLYSVILTEGNFLRQIGVTLCVLLNCQYQHMHTFNVTG